MLQLIDCNLNNMFFDLVKLSRKSIKLCSPFVKRDIVDQILEKKQNKASLTLVTNFNFNYFYKRSSDIDSIIIS